MRASPQRRVAAFALDYGVIALYIGLLLAFNLTLGRPLTDAVRAPWQAQALGFAALTLPVVLYFALSEHFAGGTLGKRRLGLRVETPAGERLPPGRSLLRSAVKFAPWELAHTALYRMVGPLSPQEMPLWPFLLSSASVVLALCYLLSLFVPPQRPLYDRLSGAVVRPVEAQAKMLQTKMFKEVRS